MFASTQFAATPAGNIWAVAQKLFGLRPHKDFDVSFLVALSFFGLGLSLVAVACFPSLVAAIAANP